MDLSKSHCGCLRARLGLFLIVIFILFIHQISSEPVRCVRKETDGFCGNFLFNYSAVPNFGGGVLTREIEQELQTYVLLHSTGCSNALIHLICSYYKPPCFPLGDFSLRLPPCRELCHYVRSSCEPVLNRFGYIWPSHFDCSRFPSSCKSRLCFPKHSTLQEYQELKYLNVPNLIEPLGIQQGTEIRPNELSIFVVGDTTITEGNKVVLSLKKYPPELFPFTVTVDIVGSNPTDYAPGPYTVTFSPGQTTANLSISTTDDNIAEPDKVFQVEITSVNPPSLEPQICHNGVSVTIKDDDVVVCSKAPENITVLEGDAANFTVKCFGEHKFDFTLYFDTFDESAVASGDYVPGPYSLFFLAGQQEASVLMGTIDDSIAELAETFKVKYMGSDQESKVVLTGPDYGYVTIEDRDVINCSKVPQNISVMEGNTAKVIIQCQGEHEFDFTLYFSTSDGSATGSDYTVDTSVSFLAGQQYAILDVVTLADDTYEMDESFQITIRGSDHPSKVGIAKEDACFVTITDSDYIVCSEVPQNVSVLEGNAAKIVVTCSGSLDFNFTLFLTAIDGSAVASADYTPGPYTLRVAAGQMTAILSVDSLEDEDSSEGDEVFQLVLSGSSEPTKVRVQDQDGCYVKITENS